METRLRVALVTSEWASAAAQLVEKHVDALLDAAGGGRRLVKCVELRRSTGEGEDAEAARAAWAVETLGEKCVRGCGCNGGALVALC